MTEFKFKEECQAIEVSLSTIQNKDGLWAAVLVMMVGGERLWQLLCNDQIRDIAKSLTTMADCIDKVNVGELTIEELLKIVGNKTS